MGRPRRRQAPARSDSSECIGECHCHSVDDRAPCSHAWPMLRRPAVELKIVIASVRCRPRCGKEREFDRRPSLLSSTLLLAHPPDHNGLCRQEHNGTKQAQNTHIEAYKKTHSYLTGRMLRSHMFGSKVYTPSTSEWSACSHSGPRPTPRIFIRYMLTEHAERPMESLCTAYVSGTRLLPARSPHTTSNLPSADALIRHMSFRLAVPVEFIGALLNVAVVPILRCSLSAYMSKCQNTVGPWVVGVRHSLLAVLVLAVRPRWRWRVARKTIRCGARRLKTCRRSAR